VHDKQRLLDCQPQACFDSINELHDWLKDRINLAA